MNVYAPLTPSFCIPLSLRIYVTSDGACAVVRILYTRTFFSLSRLSFVSVCYSFLSPSQHLLGSAVFLLLGSVFCAWHVRLMTHLGHFEVPNLGKLHAAAALGLQLVLCSTQLLQLLFILSLQVRLLTRSLFVTFTRLNSA